MFFYLQDTLILFTVYDYRKIIELVKAHFIKETNYTDKNVRECKVFYNPDEGGCILYSADDYLEPFEINPLIFGIGEDEYKIVFR